MENYAEILEVLKTIGLVLLGFLSIYIKKNEKVQSKIAEITSKASDLIKVAEAIYSDGTKQGGKKFKWVCDELYELVPAPLNKIIDRAMIEEIVQSTFNEIEAYAKIQLNKATKE